MTRAFLIAVTLIATAATGVARAEEDKPLVRWAISADEEPKQKVWTQPASVAFTSNADADDSWAVDVALRGDYALPAPGQTAQPGQRARRGTTTVFGRLVAHRNTETKNQLETYAGELGMHFEPSTYREGAGQAPGDIWFLFTDASVAYVDKTVFADPKANCAATPPPAACGDQYERSVRAQVTVSPYHDMFETTAGFADSTHTSVIGPAWTHSFSPVLTLFHDEVIDAKVNASGVTPDGGVSGLKVVLGAATSPRFADYRIVLRGSVQHVKTFQRNAARRATFEARTDLFKLSADYEFGPRSFLGETGWAPSLGVTYTRGDDPLSGKRDVDTTVIGFKLKFTP